MQETTYKGYTVEIDTLRGVHILEDNIFPEIRHGKAYERMSFDLAIAIHLAIAKHEPCSDESCKCWQAGYEKAVELR